MIEGLWYVGVAAACLIALVNWRVGLYLGLLVDWLRDPVRKLCVDHTVMVTLSGVAVWLALIAGAAHRERRELRTIFRRYPRLRSILLCVLVALGPAAALSVLLYPGGWLLAAVGLASYLVPLLGIGVGFLLPRSDESVYRVLRFYSLLNAAMLVGVLLEYLHYDWPVLGGIEMEWIRYRTGYTVDLMCGFYRSPDTMGLHAAHVIMFSLMLALRSRTASRYGWLGLVMWAGFCVLLSGRRKMVGIPLVFLTVALGLGILRGAGRINRLAGGTALVVLAAAAVLMLVVGPEERSDHMAYATTLFTEGPARANTLIIGSSIATLQQAGVLGAGLGTATQGRYYLKVQADRSGRGWQEDGVSRLVLEFGIPGVLLLVMAVLMLVETMWQAVRFVPRQSPTQSLQIGILGVVAGNAASYAISHQQFSGDPVNALFVTILVGVVLGTPRILALRRPRPVAPRAINGGRPLVQGLAVRPAQLAKPRVG